MDRGDIILLGCGGGGSAVADTIMSYEERFSGFFLNTSITDIHSLNNYDDVVENYKCLSLQNGMGRDRVKGKYVASKSGYILLDTIKNFTQKTCWITTSLGGGSGSSIASVILSGVKALREDEDEDFDKVINLIGILPNLDSAKEVLENTIDTWNEILSYGVVNNMIFIDNNNTIDGEKLSEQEINNRFAELFDSLFDIPFNNGRNFDGGNLGKILNSKGCMYIYELDEDCSNTKKALKRADMNSVLAKMYKTEDNTIEEDGIDRIKCSFIGTSFVDEKFKHEDILSKYKNTREDFHGKNEDTNLVLISGCLPPFKSIQIIKAELKDRENQNGNYIEDDFSKFVVKDDKFNNIPIDEKKVNNEKVVTEVKPKVAKKKKKKVMKKNIFSSFR